MPIQVVCSQCQAKLAAPDAAAGKRVKCRGCQAIINVPAQSDPIPVPAAPASEAATPTAPPKPKPKVVVADDDEPIVVKKKAAVVVADDDDEPAPKKAVAVVEDDDEDDDQPPRKSRDDDEDDDDDKPRKKKKKKKGKAKKTEGSNLAKNIILGIIGIVGLGIGIYLIVSKTSQNERTRKENQETEAKSKKNKEEEENIGKPINNKTPVPAAPDGWFIDETATYFCHFKRSNNQIKELKLNYPGAKEQLTRTNQLDETGVTTQILTVIPIENPKEKEQLRQSPDAIFSGLREYFIQQAKQINANASVEVKQEALFKQFRMNQFVITFPGSISVMRIISAHGRIYVLAANGPIKEDDPIVKTFFESFSPKE